MEACCPMCGGEGSELGSLGSRTHYRCRACGIDFSEAPTVPEKPKAKPTPKPWQCQECGKRFSAKGAEKAMSTGCPKCGGVDIDLHVEGAVPQGAEWGHRLHANTDSE